MLQDTLLRLPENSNEPVFICNEEHRFLVAEQVRQLSQSQGTILLEPEGRNTAPAVALAAINALEKDKDALLLVLAADHVIQDTVAFHQAVAQAIIAAQQGKLVTFGIVPTHAETGYGYIKKGTEQTTNTFDVAQFVETKVFGKTKNVNSKCKNMQPIERDISWSEIGEKDTR